MLDGRDQGPDAVKAATADTLLAEVPEPALNEVEPRATGRSEMEAKAGMTPEPALDGRALVRAGVVEDEMEVHVARRFAVDAVEEAQEFPRSMPGMQVPITVPSSRLSAAKSVVVPWRW